MMKLFVSNISYDTTEEQLREIIEGTADIVEFHRPNDRETGKPRGFAFVTLATQEDGEKAMEALNNTEIDGRAIKANEAEDRSSGGGHVSERPKWVSMKVPETKVDDRPIGSDGKRVRYKSI